MHIILGKENAEELRNRHIVLELESFAGLPGKDIVTAYCVLPAEAIFADMPDIERLQRLHQAVVDVLLFGNLETIRRDGPAID